MAVRLLMDLVHRHKSGDGVGIHSVCSAHPVALRAALREGKASGQPVLIEATSNQVNQFGGYTGRAPRDFRDFVSSMARDAGFPLDRLLLGGDHLGPNCWQDESAESAMLKSEQMVAEYVQAGFRKIHLDCSMPCADDPPVLSDEVVAARAARLCQVAEAAVQGAADDAPVYVVGTEVPTPGGAHESIDGLAVTRPEAARKTIETHREAFARRRLLPAWERVIGLVVQPGVEFDHHKVVDYVPAKARALSDFIEGERTLVYEAHSTDYQTPDALKGLVQDHFAILKVGPAATFALRETLWALADIEAQWLPQPGSSLKRVVLEAMHEHPRHWQKYYQDPDRLGLDLQFSLSDRMRYYWNAPQVCQACELLLHRLDGRALPLTLLSQYLPRQYAAIRDGLLRNDVRDILEDGVAEVLRHYTNACLPEAAAQRPRGVPVQ